MYFNELTNFFRIKGKQNAFVHIQGTVNVQ